MAIQLRAAGLLLLAAIWLGGCTASINDAVSVAADERHEGSLATVNGSIEVGARAEVTGSLRTVNGGIRLGDDARAGSAETVNGSIRAATGAHFASGTTVNGGIELAENVAVEGNLATINGRITAERGSRITGDVATTNGTIRLYGTEVAGTVTTTSGNVQLMNATRVAGGIHLRPREPDQVREPLRVIIGEGSQVEGQIRIESPARLFVHETASVAEVSGAEVERFSGERPE